MSYYMIMLICDYVKCSGLSFSKTVKISKPYILINT